VHATDTDMYVGWLAGRLAGGSAATLAGNPDGCAMPYCLRAAWPPQIN
jgi:hypothetical protein